MKFSRDVGIYLLLTLANYMHHYFTTINHMSNNKNAIIERNLIYTTHTAKIHWRHIGHDTGLVPI